MAPIRGIHPRQSPRGPDEQTGPRRRIYNLLFDKIKNELKSENPVNYNKFIKNLEFDEDASDSARLVIKAPNIYIANYVKRKYSKK